jgi:hypothetical protein
MNNIIDFNKRKDRLLYAEYFISKYKVFLETEDKSPLIPIPIQITVYITKEFVPNLSFWYDGNSWLLTNIRGLK